MGAGPRQVCAWNAHGAAHGRQKSRACFRIIKDMSLNMFERGLSVSIISRAALTLNWRPAAAGIGCQVWQVILVAWCLEERGKRVIWVTWCMKELGERVDVMGMPQRCGYWVAAVAYATAAARVL